MMTVSKTITEKLDQLANADFASPSQPTSLVAALKFGEFTSELVEVNSIACAFHHMSIATSALQDVGVAELKRIGEELGQRLTYLMEPIGPSELDAEALVLQMRSTSPTRSEDGRTYYELVVKPSAGLKLVRFEKRNGSPRSIVAANVTREVYLRLARDLVELVGQYA